MWARQTAGLVAIYVVAMAVAVEWLPWRSLDQSLFMRTSHAGALANDITIVDVRPSPADDPLANRRLIASFLDDVAKSHQQPAAVILDFTFDPCQVPCTGARASARDALVAAIASARAAHVNVFAVENLTAQSTDDPYGGETTGTQEEHDPEIYGTGGLAGNAGHTVVHVADVSGLTFYHPCYRDVAVPSESELAHAEDLWALAWRVQPGFDASLCQTQPVAFFVGPRVSAAAESYSTVPRTPPTFYTITQSNPFPKGMEMNDYVIAGALDQDTLENDAQLAGTAAGAAWERVHGPGSLNIPGPEILAWQLSDRLAQERASGSTAGAYAATHPLGSVLYVLVAVFSGASVLAFVACYYFLRRFRLRSVRRHLPWIAATAAALFGLGAFGAVEVLMALVFHQNQPQVTLVTFGIVLASALSGVRGRQMTEDLRREQDERYDYDVFISYSHADAAWVREHIETPLRQARRANGRPLSIFFDKSAIYIGDDWRKKLTLAILNSRFIIPVYSQRYFMHEGKGFCAFELECAYNKWIQLGKRSRFLLPIVRGSVDIPVEYQQVHFARLDDDPGAVERLAAEIVKTLDEESTGR